jgi:hypothetical protein
MAVGSLSPYRLVTYRFATRATTLALASGGTFLGVAMILGGPERFSSPGFATARLVPGGVYAWGGMLAAAGAVTLLGIHLQWARRTVMAGMALEGCWFAFFALTLAIAALHDPKVAVTGPVIYALVSMICAIEFQAGRGLRG